MTLKLIDRSGNNAVIEQAAVGTVAYSQENHLADPAKTAHTQRLRVKVNPTVADYPKIPKISPRATQILSVLNEVFDSLLLSADDRESDRCCVEH